MDCTPIWRKLLHQQGGFLTDPTCEQYNVEVRSALEIQQSRLSCITVYSESMKLTSIAQCHISVYVIFTGCITLYNAIESGFSISLDPPCEDGR